MRDDFAVFITTHERPKTQKTLNWLLESGYSGRYYLVIDDMDKSKDEYLQMYGNDIVLCFDKLKYWENSDTFNNKQHLAAVLYARQFVEDTAREMRLTAFLVLDDDIDRFSARMPKDGKLKRVKRINADRFINAYVDFLLGGALASISPGTQNMYLDKQTLQKFPRKGSNAFFRNVKIPINWVSAMNEDLITCVEKNKIGVMMCSALQTCCEAAKSGTGTADGGMAQIYAAMSDYERAFYMVMADPARSYLKLVKNKKTGMNMRIAREWAGGDPMIISERWKK